MFLLAGGEEYSFGRAAFWSGIAKLRYNKMREYRYSAIPESDPVYKKSLQDYHFGRVDSPDDTIMMYRWKIPGVSEG